MAAYVAMICVVLIEVGFWDSQQYKNAALWFFFAGFWSVFKVVGINEREGYFKEALLGLAKITVLVEFLVSFNSFSFWFELVFIPVFSFFVIMWEFSKLKDEHKVLSVFLERVVLVIGVGLFLHFLYMLFDSPRNFVSLGTVYDFFVPIILAIGAFPYLYALMVYAEYERVFSRVKIIFKDDLLAKYAIKMAVINFGFRLSSLSRWVHYISLPGAKEKSGIDNSIKRVLYLVGRDKEKDQVSFDMGWSRFESRRYLKSFGLVQSDYDCLYGDYWSSHSERKLGKGFLCNKIIYRAEGDEDAVKCLSLIFEVNDESLFSEDLDFFREVASSLFSQAVTDEYFLNLSYEDLDGGKDNGCLDSFTEVAGRYLMLRRERINEGFVEFVLSFAVNRDAFNSSW